MQNAKEGYEGVCLGDFLNHFFVVVDKRGLSRLWSRTSQKYCTMSAKAACCVYRFSEQILSHVLLLAAFS